MIDLLRDGEIKESEIKEGIVRALMAMKKVSGYAHADRTISFGNLMMDFIYHLDLSEKESARHLMNIFHNRTLTTLRYGKYVCLKAAALSYFLHQIKSPKISRSADPKYIHDLLLTEDVHGENPRHNSYFFTDCAVKEISRAKRQRQQFSFVILQLITVMNPQDRLLQIFNETAFPDLDAILRADLRQEDHLFRFSDSELILVLPQTGQEYARLLVERLRIRVGEYLSRIAFDTNSKFGFSAGIASYPEDGDSFEKILAVADISLHQTELNCGGNKSLSSEMVQRGFAGIERRKFSRKEISRMVFVHADSPDSYKTLCGRIIDISPGGLLMECACAGYDRYFSGLIGIPIRNLKLDNRFCLAVEGIVDRIGLNERLFSVNVAIRMTEPIKNSIFDYIVMHVGLET